MDDVGGGDVVGELLEDALGDVGGEDDFGVVFGIFALQHLGKFFDEGDALGVAEGDGNDGAQGLAEHLFADDFGEGDDALAFEGGGGEGIREEGFPEGQSVLGIFDF